MVSSRSAARRSQASSYAFFSEVKLLSHLVAGVADNTMSHGEAWHFFRLGRMIERADNTSRLLDVKYFLLLPSVEDVGGAVDEMQWSILLRSASALEMYRKRFGQISPENVVDFLLLDTDFPRSILFCLRARRGFAARDHGLAGRAPIRNRAEQSAGPADGPSWRTRSVA